MKKPIVILILLSLFVGIFTFKDYGQSWDEPDIYRYADYALNAYQYFFNPQDLLEFDTNLDFYGPAYFMLTAVLARGFMMLFPAWTIVEAWHLVYFLTFLVGVVLLYLLARRWVGELAAFGTAFLFLTQPLLWGHAFINPKDTPFLVFFTASIYLGLRMVDAPPQSFQRWGWMFASGILLGMTISFRVLGPLAGLIVLSIAVIKERQKAFLLAIPYFLIAGITAYLTWPFLWSSPIANYLQSLSIMSEFPFDAMVLFNGTLYPPDLVPRFYFLTLFALQLTEPALFLIAAGVIVLFLSFRQQDKLEPMILFIGWFLLPATAVIVLRSNLYDNARQLYFLLPPLFLASGFALEWLFKRMEHPISLGVFFLLASGPAVFAITQLHPFEYVYYNSLVGGVNGAVRRFETDYWGTSFKEAMDYVNEVAPEQGRILILTGPDDVARQYARPDLEIVTEETDYDREGNYDYVLILTRKNVNEGRCKQSELVHSVGLDDAVFTFIKKLGPEGLCK